MAIQFPPVNVGDPEPQDGETYLYLITQQEFVCKRTSALAPARWAAKGTINPTSFGYRGGLNITASAPADAETGNIYSVLDGGTAHPSFGSLGGQEVQQYTLIIYEDPNWFPITTTGGDVVQGPWIRTSGGIIQPAVPTDDLDMEQGNFLINELDELT